MYREEERLFQISLAAKEDANRRVREECTRITLELDRILDYNIVSYFQNRIIVFDGCVSVPPARILYSRIEEKRIRNSAQEKVNTFWRKVCATILTMPDDIGCVDISMLASLLRQNFIMLIAETLKINYSLRSKTYFICSRCNVKSRNIVNCWMMENLAELLAAEADLPNELSNMSTTNQLQSTQHLLFILPITLLTYRRVIHLITTRAITLLIDHIRPIQRNIRLIVDLVRCRLLAVTTKIIEMKWLLRDLTLRILVVYREKRIPQLLGRILGHPYTEQLEQREKTHFSRAYQGHISITVRMLIMPIQKFLIQHSSDGQYIAVENTSLIHDINISAWK